MLRLFGDQGGEEIPDNLVVLRPKTNIRWIERGGDSMAVCYACFWTFRDTGITRVATKLKLERAHQKACRGRSPR